PALQDAIRDDDPHGNRGWGRGRTLPNRTAGRAGIDWNFASVRHRVRGNHRAALQVAEPRATVSHPTCAAGPYSWHSHLRLHDDELAGSNVGAFDLLDGPRSADLLLL